MDMICDFENVKKTGLITTIYKDSVTKIHRFTQTERVAITRRVDIYYAKEAEVQQAVKSAHICEEKIDLLCLNDSYADYLGNYAVVCRCKRFVRQTVKTFWSINQNHSNDFSRISSGALGNTSTK